jgi:hypothetical protein
LIAADPETALKSWAGHEGIRLAERYFVSKENVLSKMKPMVFADHHPEIIGIFPHANAPKGIRTIRHANR